jgi:hypothetical protein
VTEALSRLRLGVKAKVFARFAERWWGDTDEFWLYSPPGIATSPRWAIWTDFTETTGVPMLCAFLGGTEAARVQQLAQQIDGEASLMAEIDIALRAVALNFVAGDRAG